MVRRTALGALLIVLGTGGRASEGGSARSDTIILARLDAHGSAITLTSIPRDLKVSIPGRALPDKINAAYAAGGARLAVKTVRRLLSRPGRPFDINHVVQVDFAGFRRLVDYLGCAYVDIDHRYFNDTGGPGGYATIDIQPGYQRLCGQDALDYVRFRHTDSDLIRGARQQDFIRQLLRQPGVRDRLSFAKRNALAELAGRYARTDAALKDTKQLLSLLKLSLAVADKPVRQVPFGAGELRDEGAYLVTAPSAIGHTVDEFLRPPAASARGHGGRASRSHGRGRAASAGLVDVAAAGETQAISVARRLRLPFYFPRRGVPSARYDAAQPRVYRVAGHEAYRLVVHLGVRAGEYYGIEGTSWRTPPLLDGPHRTVRSGGRKLLVYADGDRTRLVAWRTREGVYWVHNTLTRSVSQTRLTAIARSLTRLGR